MDVFFGFFPCILLTWYTRRVKERQRPLVGIAKNGKGRRTQRSSSCWDGTTLCSRRTSIKSAVLSDSDVPTWRNGVSLRVRYFSLAACQEPTESEDPWSPTFCRRQPPSFRLMLRVFPRLLRGFLTAGRAQIRVVPDHCLNRVTKTLSRGSVTRLGALATPSRVPLKPRTSRWPR